MKPKVNSQGQKDLDKAQKDFDDFKGQVDTLTLDRMNQAPKLEQGQQTEIAQSKMPEALYLKPQKFVADQAKFNEKYRKDYEYAKERVEFIAENKEMPGCPIEIWTKKFPGQQAEYWVVPVNTPVNGPRYLAEDIKARTYHRLRMDEQKIIQSDGRTAMYGQMVVDNTINRLDAIPVSSSRKSIFMGAAA